MIEWKVPPRVSCDLGSWWDGPLTECLLAGHAPYAWERAGKVLQLLAAITLVLDLVDEKWAGEKAQRARERLTEALDRLAVRRHMFDLLAVRGVAVGGLIEGTSAPDGTYLGAVVVPTPPAESYAGFRSVAPFGLEEWCRFHAETLARLPRQHACVRPHHTLCQHQHAYVLRAVETFVEQHWTPDQRRLIAQARRRARRAHVPAVLLAVGAVYLLGRAVRASDAADPTGVAYGAGFVALTMLACLTETRHVWVLGAPVVWLRGFPARRFWATLEWVLGRTKPFKELRTVAVGLFLAGWALDFLAS